MTESVRYRTDIFGTSIRYGRKKDEGKYTRKVLCMLLLLLLPVQVWGAESEPTARNEKLKLDNENRYGDMEKAYQDGYEPEVNGENVSIILPLVLNGKNEVETVTASPDLGDQNTAPFIFQNYQKTFKKTEEKINDTDRDERSLSDKVFC